MVAKNKKKEATKKGPVGKVGSEQKIAMYKEMVFYRRFEERANIAYTKILWVSPSAHRPRSRLCRHSTCS